MVFGVGGYLGYLDNRVPHNAFILALQTYVVYARYVGPKVVWKEEGDVVEALELADPVADGNIRGT